MTKLRDPFSVEEALAQVAALIGWPAVARIAARAERTVRLWSEPDQPFGCPADVAIRLDIAWRAAGGAGLPFADAHRHQVDIAAPAPLIATTLPDSFRDVLRECPEAKEAIFLVLTDPGTAARDRAAREIDEAIASLVASRAALFTTVPQVVTLGPPP